MPDTILLSHGGGGLLSAAFIDEHIRTRFSNAWLDRMGDSAVLETERSHIAFTSDSFVVSPLFFPGGNIGDLAVCGTVNDLAMAGARPQWLSLSLILEEGLPVPDLERILDTIRDRAEEAKVAVVCGDTKVVERGQADGVYINTAGLGALPDSVACAAENARPDDRILLSGAVGLHGLAVLLAREDLGLSSPITSDVAPLNGVVASLVEAGLTLHAMRDLTRGGLATALHEIAGSAAVSMELEEERIPSIEAQQAACDLLGLDPLHIACEGRFIALVPPEDADAALDVMRACPVAREAACIGTVREQDRHALELVTAVGSRRVLTMPRGEQMPRIC